MDRELHLVGPMPEKLFPWLSAWREALNEEFC